MISSLPVRRIEENPAAPVSRDDWPGTIPAVRQLLDDGLGLAPITVLVGENGSGKSTIVEAVAEAYGLGVEGGTKDVLHRTQPTESPLAAHLRLHRGVGPRQGLFLRAETMHGLFAYLSSIGSPGLHNFQSHGESFIEYFGVRAHLRGLWVFDEPESALSFTGCLRLLTHIADITAEGSQVLLATHSPVLAAVPDAEILELGEWGIRPRAWADLEMVGHWRRFLADSSRVLRHLES